MSNNTKVYEVHLADGNTETIEAHDVNTANGRVTFTGHVNGYGSGGEVVASFRADLVDSFRLVPDAEQDDKAEGKNLYRFTFTTGDTKEVRGDLVSHSAGTDSKPGRYVVATAQKNGQNRTEYVTPDHTVLDIERVADAESVKLPVQDAVKA